MADTQGIKLDPGMRERLKTLGAARDRSPHYLMRKAIEEYLEREERIERERAEDNARWEEYLATGHAISHERVEAWLDDLIAGRPAECPQ